MKIRQLASIWWRYTYPKEHTELLGYVEQCTKKGIPWESALRHTYSRDKKQLPAGLQRLLHELGSRVFDPQPTFCVGDGATIVHNGALFPVTVIDVTRQKAVIVRQCEEHSRHLSVPAEDGPTHTATRRATGEWKLRGSRTTQLIYGRRSSCENP